MAAAKLKRGDRVGGRIKEELMQLLLRGEISDPATAGACVSRVAVTDDLRHARIYVRLLDPEPSEAARTRVVKALQRASGHIRRQLAPRLQVKYQPELKFFWDEGVDTQARVEAVLDELRRDGDLT